MDNKCEQCAYLKQCDEFQKTNCKNMDYILFTTEQDKKLCDLFCPFNNEE